MDDPIRETSAPILSWLGGAWDRLVQFNASAATPAAASATLARTVPDATSPRILVVEDHPPLQVLTRTMLDKMGATTWLAQHGGEAYAMACETEFDLILMDLQMPVLDGLSATRKIRRFEEDHARVRVPVVAYTASVYSGCEAFWAGLGIDAVLEKPCRARELQECLLHWLPAGRVFGNARTPGRGASAQPG